MEEQNKQDYDKINRHLENRTGVIAITQGSSKFAKPWATTQRYNWTKQDILRHTPEGVEAFIKSLSKHGYTSGTKLIVRRMEGSTPKYKGEIELFFPDTPQTPVAAQTVTQPTKTPQENPTRMETQPITTPVTQQQSVQQMAAPVVSGMGYTQIPQHEMISLKVKEERYIDLTEKLKKAEEELLATKSDLRLEKEKSYAAERKNELLEDKWQLKLDRELNDKKGFLDTDTGKEVATALAGAMPNIISALSQKNQPQVNTALGNPIANFSPVKQQFIAKLQSLDDGFIPVLSKTVAVIEIDGFAEELLSYLDNISSQNPS